MNDRIEVDLLSMRRATRLLHQAGDRMAGNPRRALEGHDTYRHEVSPRLAGAMDSFADRWNVALGSLADLYSGTADALADTQTTLQAADENAWQAINRHGSGL